jgi:hypothetical protein
MNYKYIGRGSVTRNKMSFSATVFALVGTGMFGGQRPAERNLSCLVSRRLKGIDPFKEHGDPGGTFLFNAFRR